MKIRRSIFCFVFIAIALIALTLWYGKMRPLKTTITSIETNTTLSAPNNVRSSPTSASISSNALSAEAASNTAVPPQNKGDQIKEGLSTLNDAPIAFYGRLEDQFGNAVSDAQIAASVRIYNGVQSTVEHLAAVSDGNGMFQIKGGRGESLGIMPKKDGYVLATTGTEFKYSYMYANHFTPDPNNPTVVKMWKLQGAEPLVGIDKNYKLHYTNAPISFDLVTGEIVPIGGDIKITVNRPAGEISEHNPQDWGFAIEAVDGGLVETSGKDSAITFAAPENGYQSSDTVTASSNRHGIGGIQQGYFVKSRNGQVYSKFGLTFGINDTPDGFMNITFSGVANTNSSRNWEANAPQ
jgi:hypothetical protein